MLLVPKTSFASFAVAHVLRMSDVEGGSIRHNLPCLYIDCPAPMGPFPIWRVAVFDLRLQDIFSRDVSSVAWQFHSGLDRPYRRPLGSFLNNLAGNRPNVHVVFLFCTFLNLNGKARQSVHPSWRV